MEQHCSRQKYFLSHLLLCLSFFLLLQSVTFAATDPTPQKVLVINAYHRGFKWTDSITNGIESVLETGPEKIRRQVEYIYMDTKRIYNPEYLQKLRDIYRFKFKKGEFDVIIASDNNALSFLTNYRDQVFGPTPVVFCGINDYDPKLLNGASGYTGINELPDLAGNVELIRKLQPDIKKLYVIEDDTPTGKRTHRQLTRLLPQYEGTLEFIPVSRISMADLKTLLGTLNKDSAVLYTTFFRDSAGEFFEYDESANLISAASNVPVYATWDFSLGFGVIGGKLTDGFSQGEAAARIALRILDGEPVESIPVRMESPSRYLFDEKVLNRFSLPKTSLPEGSYLINSTDSRYSSLLVRASLAIVFLTGLILVLLANIRRRKIAETAMRLTEERFQALLGNSAVGIGVTDIDGNYVQMNDAWVQMLKADRQNVTDLTIDGETPLSDRTLRRETYDKLTRGDAKTFRHERLFLRSDGSNFWGDHTVTPIHDTRGNVIAAINLTIDITQRKQAENEIRQLAFFDSLTKLPNRTLFNDRLSQALRMARREDYLLGLLFLDLDRFKDINDSLGHSAGDKLLQKVAERLSNCVRSTDTVGRLGGDEFIILLQHINSREDIESIAAQILTAMQTPTTIFNQEVFCSTSIGAAIFPYDGCDQGQLLKHADMAMYASKTKGRNTCTFFSSEIQKTSSERIQMEADLRKALYRGEFFLEYQPQYNLQSGRIIGVEALLRWCHPERGVILPGEFIPLAESTGLIRPIGEWVLETACRQGARWNSKDLSSLRIGVNLSVRQLVQPDLVDIVEDVLAETGLPPNLLELELTESTFMESARDVIDTLTDLKVRGIQLAIDDFGTGYSSLNYLKNFPVDRIKIDRTFIRDILVDPNDAIIVETIISMARNLGLTIIAEGVEGIEQVQFLTQRQCYEAQGFYFNPPLPADQIVKNNLNGVIETVTESGTLIPVPALG